MAESLQHMLAAERDRLRRAPGLAQQEARHGALRMHRTIRMLTPERSGRLRASIELDGGPKGAGRALYRVHTEEPYAHVVEEGGRVQGEPLLTIPLVPESFGRVAQDMGGLFPVRRRGESEGLLARRDGRGLRFLFALKHTARVPGHHMFARACEQHETPNATQVLDRIDKARRP